MDDGKGNMDLTDFTDGDPRSTKVDGKEPPASFHHRFVLLVFFADRRHPSRVDSAEQTYLYEAELS